MKMSLIFLTGCIFASSILSADWRTDDRYYYQTQPRTYYYTQPGSDSTHSYSRDSQTYYRDGSQYQTYPSSQYQTYPSSQYQSYPSSQYQTYPQGSTREYYYQTSPSRDTYYQEGAFSSDQTQILTPEERAARELREREERRDSFENRDTQRDFRDNTSSYRYPSNSYDRGYTSDAYNTKTTPSSTWSTDTRDNRADAPRSTWGSANDSRIDTRSDSTWGSSNATARPNDQELTTKVQDALKGGAFSKGYKNVNVRVVNAVVTLSGSVDNEQERQDVKSKILGIKGVRNIDDQLDIRMRDNSSRAGYGSSSY